MSSSAPKILADRAWLLRLADMMVERRMRRSDRVFAAVQLYLESLSERHACRALVLATDEGLAVAGTGSEADLTEVSAVATSRVRAAAHGVQSFSIMRGTDRFFVGALGGVPELECTASLARILAVPDGERASSGLGDS